MARPRRDDNKIYLHVRRNGKSTYASANEAYDSNGERSYRIVDWGTLENGNAFVPNKRFIYAKDLWGTFVFPEGWDLGKLEELKSRYKPGRPAYTKDDRSLLYGSVWLLTEIARKVGLIDDLMRVFEGNTDMANDVLTLAFFPLVSGKSYNHLAQWQKIERFPSAGILTSRDVTLLTQSITEGNRMDLFTLRSKRMDKSHVLAVDSTSKSTYGRTLADIRWGKNKEGLALAQTNEVVVYSLNGHMPVVYQQLAGNIPDMRTVELIQKILDHCQCPNAPLLTDRGYLSQSVIDFLLQKGHPFISCIKADSSIVAPVIEAARAKTLGMEINIGTQNYEAMQPVRYYYEDRSGEGRKAVDLKACIYFSSVRQSIGLTELDISLKEQRLELEDLKTQKTVIPVEQELRRDCDLYDIVFDDHQRVQSFSVKEKKVESRKRTMGFIAMLVNGMDLDASSAWHLYSLRDEQEKYFSDMKGAMLDDRNPAWSEKGKEGRMFVHFAGLIVYSYIKDVWKRLNLRDEFETVAEVIDEMKNIRCIEHTGKAKIITPFVGRQLDICEYYGLEVPEGCAPRKKKISSKTGRKNKNAAQE